MSNYQHRVSGFFVKLDAAHIARAELRSHGVPENQIAIYASEDEALAPAVTHDSDDTLKHILVDGAIGTAVGTGLGALGEIALVATSVTLFVASPLIAPLSMLGWGASVGAVIGAVAGSTNLNKAGGKFSDLVGDAIQYGQVVLVVTTTSPSETQAAIDVMQAAVGSYKDMVST